jgi:hypothetical protein
MPMYVVEAGMTSAADARIGLGVLAQRRGRQAAGEHGKPHRRVLHRRVLHPLAFAHAPPVPHHHQGCAREVPPATAVVDDRPTPTRRKK